MKYYMFNVDNPEEIKQGARPKVTEYGPYVYREYRRKDEVTPIGQDKLSYGQQMEYVFDAEETHRSNCFNGQDGVPCDKTDKVLVINSPLAGAIDMLHDLPPIPIQHNGINTTLPSILFHILDSALFSPFFCKIISGVNFCDS